MKISPKFIQKNCVEGNKVDMQQANAVLKYKPDIVLFEYPTGKTGPDAIFNKYSTNKKPLKKVDGIIKNRKISAKKYPYAESDIFVWQNIKKLWSQDHNVLIFNIDAPDELRREYFENLEPKYPQARKDFLFWVYLYLREIYMTKNMEKILKSYSEKENPTVAVFLQSIHWQHVQFLLTKPNKSKIWKYYFGRFPKLKPKTIDAEIKKRSLFLYRWWNKQNF